MPSSKSTAPCFGRLSFILRPSLGAAISGSRFRRDALCGLARKRPHQWRAQRPALCLQIYGQPGAAVSISSPANHSVFEAGTSLMIQAQASDADGTVQKVEFLADGNKLGEDNDGSNGFSFLWNNIPAADHDLTARAVDNYGIKTSSAAVRIILARPPEIHLNRTALSFGAPQGGIPTAAQPVLITNSGGGALAWTAVRRRPGSRPRRGAARGPDGHDRRRRDGTRGGELFRDGRFHRSERRPTRPGPSRST